MRKDSVIYQPDWSTAIATLSRMWQSARWTTFIAAAPFATVRGVLDLIGAFAARKSIWNSCKKSIVVDLSSRITDGKSVRLLTDLPNSDVRISSRRGDANAGTFHAKIFGFLSESPMRATALVGSFNITRAGLATNRECGTVLEAKGETGATARALLQDLLRWARSLDKPRRADFLIPPPPKPVRKTQAIRESEYGEHTEGAGDREELELSALRSAPVLWTQTWKIVPNRGPLRPGNQIDLKKGARIFFGSDAPLDLPPNSPLGNVRIVAGKRTLSRPMRYGDNGMDKLALPNPEEIGLDNYERQFLEFVRQASGAFRLKVHSKGQSLRRLSKKNGLLFNYGPSPGRKWGVIF